MYISQLWPSNSKHGGNWLFYALRWNWVSKNQSWLSVHCAYGNSNFKVLKQQFVQNKIYSILTLFQTKIQKQSSNIFILFHRRKNVLQVWNNMKVSEWNQYSYLGKPLLYSNNCLALRSISHRKLQKIWNIA